MRKENLSVKSHYVALDGLRGIAAIAVVISHYFDVFYAGDPLRNPVIHSYLAVDFFFCLSGFIIAYAYDERMKTIGIKRFFLNRLIRLHPLVVIGSTIGVIAYVIDPFLEYPLASGGRAIILAFIMSLFMLPTPFLKYRHEALFTFNTPTWSLFFEYFINVFYALALSRITRRWLVIIGVLSAVFLIYVTQDFGWFAGGWGRKNYIQGFARVGFSFTAGLLIFRYHMIWRHRLGFLLPCILLIGVFLSPHRRNDWAVELSLVMTVLPSIVCLGAGTSTAGITERLCNLLGRISYPLYMTHVSTVFLFEHYYRIHKPTDIKLFLMVVSLIGFNLLFAYVIMRWVDEPVRKWLNKLIRRKDKY